MSDWHCKQIITSSLSPIVVCEREDLLAEIERLSAKVDRLESRGINDMRPTKKEHST